LFVPTEIILLGPVLIYFHSVTQFPDPELFSFILNYYINFNVLTLLNNTYIQRFTTDTSWGTVQGHQQKTSTLRPLSFRNILDEKLCELINIL
jgi:hypothetical protein